MKTAPAAALGHGKQGDPNRPLSQTAEHTRSVVSGEAKDNRCVCMCVFILLLYIQPVSLSYHVTHQEQTLYKWWSTERVIISSVLISLTHLLSLLHIKWKAWALLYQQQIYDESTRSAWE